MASTVWLARHGNREDFVDPTWRSRAARPFDPELSPDGRDQARCLARRLASEAIDAIFASPFLRTMQTASAVAERTGIPIAVEPGLSEWFNPEWFAAPPNLHSTAELAQSFERVRLDHVAVGAPSYPETAEQALSRVGTCARQLTLEPYDSILLVGHGVTVSGALHSLLGRHERHECALCSIFKLQAVGAHWELVISGDVSHLESSLGAQRFN
jgi:broad specificity phosphatase PhoE